MVRVVPPGGKPPKKRFDLLAEALFQCLPANSHDELLTRLKKETGDKSIRIKTIGNVLLWIRRNPKRAGYDVCHSPRGKLAKDDEGFRFQAVLLPERGRRTHFDPGGRNAIVQGIVGTVRMLLSLSKNEHVALQISKDLFPAAADQRAIATAFKHLRRLAEDSEELEEFVVRMNGTTK